MRPLERPGVRTGFLVLVLFSLLAGDAWRYTIGWIGFGVIVALVTAASVALLVLQRGRWSARTLPYPLLAFLLLATASLLWSVYPGATALGLAGTWVTVVAGVAVAVTYRWTEVLRGLGIALRLILGASLLLELFVAVILRAPLLPPVPQPGINYANLPDNIPKMLFWSRNELFQLLDGGKIQGIVGNSALLSFVALLAIIVIALQLADRTVRTRTGLPWLTLALAAFVATRAATNVVGLIAAAIVVVAVLLVRRAASDRARGIIYALIGAVAVVGGVTAFLLRNTVFALLGKSSDLTNRGDIWEAVVGLAQQRPTFGWGWVSYWVPWVAPFDDLAFNNGVRQLHAHNAWLDIWLQLGVAGLVVFGALILSSLQRSWSFAVDRRQAVPGERRPYAAATLQPLLLLVALLVQSVAESRLIVEYGMFLVVLIAVKTKSSEREVLPA